MEEVEEETENSPSAEITEEKHWFTVVSQSPSKVAITL